MSEIKFVDGLLVKAPRDGAPDFIKCAISIKREELIAWLNNQGGEWINIDVKESKGGKWYAAVNDWKPDGDKPAKAKSAPRDDSGDDQDIPF